MAVKLTFKQYLASKEALREAVKQTPKQTKSYTVNKYCSFPIGESKDARTLVNLKPTSTIEIDWLYENVDDPTPTAISVTNLKSAASIDDVTPAWTGHKIQKWLLKNTTED